MVKSKKKDSTKKTGVTKKAAAAKKAQAAKTSKAAKKKKEPSNKAKASGTKVGAKNQLTQEQNDELEIVLEGYFSELESSGVINLPPGAHLPHRCVVYKKAKREELLTRPAFANLSSKDMDVAEETINVAFYNYKRQRFRPKWFAKHGAGANQGPVDTSSAAGLGINQEVDNGDVEGERNKYLELVRSSHQGMIAGGQLGKSSLMIAFIMCEDEGQGDRGVAQIYSVTSGIDEGVVIPGQEKFMKEFKSFFQEVIDKDMDIDSSYNDSAEGNHMEIDLSTNDPSSDFSTMVAMLSSTRSPSSFTTPLLEPFAESLDTTSQSLLPNITLTGWPVPTSDISLDDLFSPMEIAQSSVANTAAMESSLIPVTGSSSSESRLWTDYCDEVERWPERLDYDVATSGNANCEELNAILSHDSLDQSFPIQQTTLTSLASLHYELPSETSISADEQRASIPYSLASLNNFLPETTSVTHEPHTASPLTSLANLSLLSHEQLRCKRPHHEQQHDDRHNLHTYPSLSITHRRTSFPRSATLQNHSYLLHAQQPIFDPLQHPSHINLGLRLEPNTFIPSPPHLDYSMRQPREVDDREMCRARPS